MTTRSRLPAQAQCYLIHFREPLGGTTPHSRAQHYIGWAVDLTERMEDHRAGRGARIMAAVEAAGISWEITRVWPGGYVLEKRLKKLKNARMLCPRCNAGAWQRGLLAGRTKR